MHSGVWTAKPTFYVGDIAAFERECDADLAVLAYAVEKFGLSETLKISVHSGSDKFSLYPIIRRLVDKHGAGLHLKTAGTTWLEEVAGLAEVGGEGLDLAREIYARAHARAEELIKPYAPVVDIDIARLPSSMRSTHGIQTVTSPHWCMNSRVRNTTASSANSSTSRSKLPLRSEHRFTRPSKSTGKSWDGA